jgi:hypothetical protein
MDRNFRVIDLKGNDTATLEEVLNSLRCKRVDINTDGDLSRLDSIACFNWFYSRNKRLLVLSDDVTENYWFIKTDRIREWSYDIIDGVEFLLKDGTEIQLYEC